MQPAIEIRNLGKEYHIATSQPYLALRDVITHSAKNLFSSGRSSKEKFFALQGISLDIQAGERIGIIGRNGAGKSTLLKIISRITPPTTGHISLLGRVGSLLEVGTGFHPELTGRENIYLNGSILGMKKTEINRQLDAIIDFSGVEKFLDTPLKHYSSGMQLRLAFAVAAHLEPEILLIDEVLAVGDIEFQKKCIGKMEEVSKGQGRTILLVSHNMGTIQSFCNKVLYLSDGKMKAFGEKDAVIAQYLKDITQSTNRSKSTGNGKATIQDTRLLSGNHTVSEILMGYPVTIAATISAAESLENVEVAFNIRNIFGEIITHSTTLDRQLQWSIGKDKPISVEASLSSLNLSPGYYSLDIFVLNKGELCHGITDMLEFTVLNSDKALRPDGFPAHVKIFSDTQWKTSGHETV